MKLLAALVLVIIGMLLLPTTTLGAIACVFAGGWLYRRTDQRAELALIATLMVLGATYAVWQYVVFAWEQFR